MDGRCSTNAPLRPRLGQGTRWLSGQVEVVRVGARRPGAQATSCQFDCGVNRNLVNRASRLNFNEACTRQTRSACVGHVAVSEYGVLGGVIKAEPPS